MPDPIAIGDLIAYVRARSTKELIEILGEINEEFTNRVVPDNDTNVDARGGIRPTTLGNPL